MTALRDAFERDGVVRVAGAIAPEDVDAMRACAREQIATLELVDIAGARRPAPGTELALWDIGRDPAFARLPSAFARAVDHVFGPGVWAQVDGELGGLLMPNLPCPGAPWTLSDVSWHVDEPTPLGDAPGRVLLGYALLDRVEPTGGATAVIAGSHRRLAALAQQRAAPINHADALVAFARAEPWFATLALPADPNALPEGCISAGIGLSVVALTGEAGDLVLLDPRCLHTITANTSPRPRLIMRLTCMRV